MPRRHHLVFVNRVFPPDRGASGQYLSALVSALDRDRWRVTVLTTKTVACASYAIASEGVETRRVTGLPVYRKWLWYRSIAYLSLYPALLVGLFKVGRADAIVVMTDPPLFSAVAARYGKWRNIPVILWCQDLYPELAFNIGLVRQHGLIGRALTRIRDRALDRCASIIAIGRCMAQRLSERTKTHIRIIPNWADVETIRPIPHERNPVRTELLAAPDGQIVMYSGNFGLAHPFNAIIAAAGELSALAPRVRFVFIGDGPRLPRLKEEAQKRGLQNVRFLPYQPYSQLCYTLSAADLHLVSMEPGMQGLVVPSKIYGILAAGRPCLFIGPPDGEAAKLISERQAGEVLSSANEAALGSCLLRWLGDGRALDEAGKNARAAAEKMTLSDAANAFQSAIAEVIFSSRQSPA